ncbi:hypothetical protein [Vreelandella sp. H-I2]|jgi:Na+/H+ antiporter NhaC
MPIIILVLAYSLNQLSKNRGTANYNVEATAGWLTPTLLSAMTFLNSVGLRHRRE